MNKPIGTDLKALFVIQIINLGVAGLLGVLAPGTMIRLAGLDPAAAPAIQQSGGLALGFVVGAILALRAAAWEQVRIFVAASLAAYALSLIGAFYYVVIVGVASPGLIAILIFTVILTVGFAWAWWKYDRAPSTSGRMARS